ncbi:MAG: CDP-alcohol phosphatidyltransferase family protein [Ruminococcaceae bacterium]|nr:CDP-alcohol phosphatidyltransferase family protein [Oscillospiraceae bacterium]
MKLKNIPNILSIIRIGLVFVFIALFFTDHIYSALLVFFVAGATDVLDGYLARRNNWVSNLGKILDPFADKMMQFTVLICLYVGDFIPLWFVLPFVIKELFTLLAGLIVIKRRSVAVVSKWYGKLTVCLFYLTIAISVLFKSFFDTHIVLQVILFVPAVVFAVFSLAAYIKHYAYLKNEEPKHGDILKMRKE